MKGVLFHQDNAPAHKSVVAMTAVLDCGFELVESPSIFSEFGTIWHEKNTWLRSSIGPMMRSNPGGGGALMYNVRWVCVAYKTPVFTPDCRSQDTRFSIICRSIDPRNDATLFKIRSIAYRISWCVRTACRGRRSLVLRALARALV